MPGLSLYRGGLAGAFRYMLAGRTALARVFDDGRPGLDNNPACLCS